MKRTTKPLIKRHFGETHVQSKADKREEGRDGREQVPWQYWRSLYLKTTSAIPRFSCAGPKCYATSRPQHQVPFNSINVMLTGASMKYNIVPQRKHSLC